MSFDLPVEIYHYIFVMLPIKERTKSRAVCKYWKDMLDQKILWKDILYIPVGNLGKTNLNGIMWISKNTCILDNPLFVSSFVTIKCNREVFDWILNGFHLSEKITSSPTFLLHLFTTNFEAARDRFTEIVFQIISRKYPDYIKICHSEIFKSPKFLPSTKISLMKLLGIEMSDDERFEFAIQLAVEKYHEPDRRPSYHTSEAKDIIKGYKMPNKYIERIRREMSNYIMFRDISALISFTIVFNLQHPDNEHLIPYQLSTHLKFLERYLIAIEILPETDRDIWKSELHQNRSANFIYNSLMRFQAKENDWVKVFEWCMASFRQVMKHVQEDDICSENIDEYPCLISIVSSLSDHKPLKTLMDVMELNENAIVKHCLCIWYSPGFYPVIIDSSSWCLQRIIDNAKSLGLNKVAETVIKFCT